jgi:hypothetical protein
MAFARLGGKWRFTWRFLWGFERAFSMGVFKLRGRARAPGY